MIGAEDFIKLIITACRDVVKDTAANKGIVNLARASFVCRNVSVETMLNRDDIL